MAVTMAKSSETGSTSAAVRRRASACASSSLFLCGWSLGHRPPVLPWLRSQPSYVVVGQLPAFGWRHAEPHRRGVLAVDARQALTQTEAFRRGPPVCDHVSPAGDLLARAELHAPGHVATAASERHDAGRAVAVKPSRGFQNASIGCPQWASARLLSLYLARVCRHFFDGANRDRTGDLLLAKQALSQLSYGPKPSEFSRGPPCREESRRWS